MVDYLKQMERELENLKKDRPEMIKVLQEAREHGDLKENAEYDDARNNQAILESRIKSLESQIMRVRKKKEENKRLGKNTVRTGSRVVVVLNDTGKEMTVTVSPPESGDPESGLIAEDSPLGAALFGRQPGDEISVKLPTSIKTMRIKKIS